MIWKIKVCSEPSLMYMTPYRKPKRLFCSTYDELGPKDLSTLMGFNESAFENLGNPCVIVMICDTVGKLTQEVQRARWKSALKAIEDNFEQYSAMSVFFILENHVCQNCIKPIRDNFTLANTWHDENESNPL